MEYLNNFLAKSNGDSLISHSKLVEKKVLEIDKINLSLLYNILRIKHK